MFSEFVELINHHPWVPGAVLIALGFGGLFYEGWRMISFSHTRAVGAVVLVGALPFVTVIWHSEIASELSHMPNPKVLLALCMCLWAFILFLLLSALRGARS